MTCASDNVISFHRRQRPPLPLRDRTRVLSRIRCMHLVFRLLLAGFALAWIPGCASDPVPPGSRFVVSAPFAEFYKKGPAQDVGFAQHSFDNYLTEQYTGPDFQLPKGAAVTMLKRESGYSKVVTDNGIAGYVANDRLKPAPAVARTVPTEVRPQRNIRERVRAVPPSRRNEDQLDLSDIPLPLPS